VKLRVLVALVALAAGPVAAGDPPPLAVAKASSGAAPPAAPPTAKATSPEIEARSWTLIDARTGRVLQSHAAARPLPIASTTKLMTAYVAMQELPLAKIVRAAPYDPIYGESLLNLRAGQPVSVRDLLYGLILRSGNDAAYDLARAAAGSEGAFVHQMNLRAAALGLSDTHYANPIGLDQAGNYSSAADLATLTAHLLREPAFARIAASKQARLRSLRPPRRITTINELLHLEPWVTGVKTGHTFDAGYVLVGSGRRKGVELISVVIGAPTPEARDGESLDLLESGFAEYRRRVPVRAGQEMADPAIRFAGGSLPLRAARSVAAGTYRGQRLGLDVEAPAEVVGPIERGTVLGRATVLVDGRPAGSTPLRAGRSIPEANLFDKVRSFVSDHTILTAVALFVILIGAAFLGRAVRRRRTRGDQGDRWPE
jgi:D-alanyl-D-alanine carboxypeptidase (penicillin-binding protein 5/6)